MKAAWPALVKPELGMLARLYGQTMRILKVNHLFATLEGPDGELDVTLDRVRPA